MDWDTQLLSLYILFSQPTAVPGWPLSEGLKVFSKTFFIFLYLLSS